MSTKKKKGEGEKRKEREEEEIGRDRKKEGNTEVYVEGLDEKKMEGKEPVKIFKSS